VRDLNIQVVQKIKYIVKNVIDIVIIKNV